MSYYDFKQQRLRYSAIFFKIYVYSSFENMHKIEKMAYLEYF